MEIEKKWTKVIYMGFPMELNTNEKPMQLRGFWSFVADWFPVDSGGWYFQSYKGNYLIALWEWLTPPKRKGQD